MFATRLLSSKRYKVRFRHWRVELLLSVLIVSGLQRGSASAQEATPAPPPADSAPREAEEQRRKAEDQQQRRPQRIYETPRIYRIEGKILMAGGGPPPDRVAVAAVCAGQSFAKVSSDLKGNFSLQLGAFSATTPDASIGRATGTGFGSPTGADVPVRECELLAFLPGFRAGPVKLAGLQSPVNVTRVTIILKPVENVSGYTFSATSLFASKEARKAQEKGSEALNRRKLEQAERELRRAVELYPKYAIAWYDLGRVLIQQQRPQDARKALEAAVSADPKYISPYPVLAQLAFDEKRWEDLARYTQTVITFNPFFSANIYVFSAQANLLLQRLDVAELHAREALRMDPEHKLPVAQRILGRVLAKKGNLREAIDVLRLCLMYTAAGPESDLIKTEIAGLEQQISQH